MLDCINQMNCTTTHHPPTQRPPLTTHKQSIRATKSTQPCRRSIATQMNASARITRIHSPPHIPTHPSHIPPEQTTPAISQPINSPQSTHIPSHYRVLQLPSLLHGVRVGCGMVDRIGHTDILSRIDSGGRCRTATTLALARPMRARAAIPQTLALPTQHYCTAQRARHADGCTRRSSMQRAGIVTRYGAGCTRHTGNTILM